MSFVHYSSSGNINFDVLVWTLNRLITSCNWLSDVYLPPYRFTGVLRISRKSFDYKFGQQNMIFYILLTKLLVKVISRKAELPYNLVWRE
jgi:hypothetical protein